MHAFRLAKSLKFHSPFLCLLFQKQVSNFQANETIVQSKNILRLQQLQLQSFSVHFDMVVFRFLAASVFRPIFFLQKRLQSLCKSEYRCPFSTFKAQYIVITKRIPNGINASRSNQKNNGTADKRVITRCTVKMLP